MVPPRCYLNRIEESKLYAVDPDFQTADNLTPEKNRLKLSLKGIVRLNSSDPLCKNTNARFKTVFLKSLAGQV